jgi:hypothetical protein
MPEIKEELLFQERFQFLVIVALSIGALGLVFFSDAHIFLRFFGGINPLLAFGLICFLGIAFLSFLLSQGWFAIYKQENLIGQFRTSALALIFGLNAILLDLMIVFPADMNIPFPASLLFYPAIDFFVQILFHVLPLTVLLVTLSSIFKNVCQEKLIWICIFIVSPLEPIYHMLDMNSLGTHSLWAVALVGLHVFLINFFRVVYF